MSWRGPAGEIRRRSRTLGPPGGRTVLRQDRTFRRRWAAAFIFSALSLALGAWLTDRCCGERQAVGWTLAAGIPTLYVLWQFARALPYHVGPTQVPLARLGSSTVATLLRGLICAWLIGLVGTRISVEALGWGPALALFAACALDMLDGRWARRDGTASEMGRRLDLELDGLMAFAGYALAVHLGKLPAVFLFVGVLRFLYLAGAWVYRSSRASLGALPPSQARRVVASLQSGFLVGVLFPIVRPPISILAGGVIAAALLASFGRDALIQMRLLDAAAHGRLVSRLRYVLLTVVPVPLRFGLAAGLLGEAIGSSPRPILWQVVLTVAIPCLILGFAARTASLAVIVGYLGLFSTASPTDGQMVTFTAACVVVLLGSGARSLAAPEARLFGGGSAGVRMGSGEAGE